MSQTVMVYENQKAAGTEKRFGSSQSISHQNREISNRANIFFVLYEIKFKMTGQLPITAADVCSVLFWGIIICRIPAALIPAGNEPQT